MNAELKIILRPEVWQANYEPEAAVRISISNAGWPKPLITMTMDGKQYRFDAEELARSVAAAWQMVCRVQDV